MIIAEPISPELVLVCPELRERALAQLPPLPWEAFAPRRAEVALARRAPAVPALHEAMTYALTLLVPLGALALGSLLVTLCLTLLAGVSR